MAASALSLLLPTLGTAARALARRISQGPKHPNWSVSFEITREVLRSHMDRAYATASAPAQRALMDAVTPPSPNLRRVRVSEVRAGGVPSRWFVPKKKGDAGRTFLFLHGGGYVVHAKGHEDFAASMALSLKARTLLPDYRLAPEHPFPAAVEDAVAVYEYLLSQGTDPKRIIVGGDSAGGGLTLALLQELKAKGRPLPALALLLSPWLDLGCSGESFRTNEPYDWLPPAMGRQWAGWYLNGQDSKNPLASPYFADVRGLPPIYIQAGEAECLYDQIRIFTGRVRQDGGRCEIDTWPGMIHDFHILGPLGVPEAKDAMAKLARRADEAMRTA